MRGTKTVLLIITAILFSTIAFCQDTTGRPVGMADQMRSSGRIYVVIAVMLTILVGLVLYIVRLDRKIGKWEKQENKG